MPPVNERPSRKSDAQQNQLARLVRWCDELSELQSLEDFMAEAIYQLAENDRLGEGSVNAQGLHLIFRELDRRLVDLKTDIHSECRRLRGGDA